MLGRSGGGPQMEGSLTAHQISVLSCYGDLRRRFPDAGRDAAPEGNEPYQRWWIEGFKPEMDKRGTPDFQPGKCRLPCCGYGPAPAETVLPLEPSKLPAAIPFVKKATSIVPLAVAYNGPLASQSGYGSAAWNNVRALMRAGVYVRATGAAPSPHGPDASRWGFPSQWSCRTILHEAPGQHAEAADIRYTVQEMKAVPESWVSSMNRDGQIWTASDWCRRIFKDAGVTVPIHVVPHCLDEHEYRPGVPRVPIRNAPGYRFLWLGHWMERKNPRGALRAFLRAFDGVPDVTLLVRASAKPDSGDAAGAVSQAACELVAEEGIAHPPNIVTMDRVAPEALPSLFASVDCLYIPVRCEGFGVPLIEAMASGIPIITTDWPAMNEVVSPECARLVKARPVPVPDQDMAWARWSYRAGSDALWAEPDGDGLVDALRWMKDHLEEGAAMGARGRERFLKYYTLAKVGQTMVALLEASQ